MGYNMTIEKNAVVLFDSARMSELVLSHIPSATLLADVGTEMTFQLPLNSTGHFQALFDQIDCNDKVLGVQSYGESKQFGQLPVIAAIFTENAICLLIWLLGYFQVQTN